MRKYIHFWNNIWIKFYSYLHKQENNSWMKVKNDKFYRYSCHRLNWFSMISDLCDLGKVIQTSGTILRKWGKIITTALWCNKDKIIYANIFGQYVLNIYSVRNILLLLYHYGGWGKVYRFTVVSMWNSLFLLLINYCIIFHKKTVNLLLSNRELHYFH